MYNKKNLAVIFVFIALFVTVLYSAVTARRNVVKTSTDKGQDKAESSYFKQVHYFKITDLIPQAELQASYLDIKDNKFLAFVQPNGFIFRGDQKIHYEAESGNLNEVTSYLNLKGSVKIKDQKNRYSSDEFEYFGKQSVMEAQGNVRSRIKDESTQDVILLTSKRMKSWMDEKRVELNGDVKGQVIRKRAYEGKLYFESDLVTLNQRESYVKLDKYVKVRQNKMYLTAGNGEIFLGNFNKKLKYYALYDDVRMEESLRLESGIFQTRKAYAEKLESHQRTGKIILTGAPRVEQGADVIKGYQITLREAVEMIEVDDSQSSFKLKRKD